MKALRLCAALVFMVFCLCAPASAANITWVCPSNLQVLNGSGSITSAAFFTPLTAGWYDIKVAVSPASSTLAASAGPSLSYTSDGVARTTTAASVSLGTVSLVSPPAFLSLYLDAQPVTFTMTAPTGNYNLRACWRPSST